MKKIKITKLLDNKHRSINEIVVDTAGVLGESYLLYKLDDLLTARGITQKDLAQMTGLRVGTISDMVNGKILNVNLVHLVAIMSALRITEVKDILAIRVPLETEEMFREEAYQWINDREMPPTVRELYTDNILKANQLK